MAGRHDQMTQKELKKLNRQELLTLMISQRKEIERLNKELAAARSALEDRNLRIDNAGSIAEAAVGITELFEKAQQAADLYLENVRRLYPSGQEKTGEGS